MCRELIYLHNYKFYQSKVRLTVLPPSLHPSLLTHPILLPLLSKSSYQLIKYHYFLMFFIVNNYPLLISYKISILHWLNLFKSLWPGDNTHYEFQMKIKQISINFIQYWTSFYFWLFPIGLNHTLMDNFETI